MKIPTKDLTQAQINRIVYFLNKYKDEEEYYKEYGLRLVFVLKNLSNGEIYTKFRDSKWNASFYKIEKNGNYSIYELKNIY